MEDAGEFGAWAGELDGAIRGERPSNVACGTCTACCTASQFIHVAPDERATLAAIPKALRFRAPGMPRGHVLLGYDARGHCPMLVDGACSIYEVRPRTCRTYDCRVFAAAEVEPVEPDQRHIAERARRWRFRFASEADRAQQRAVAAAARFLATHRDALAGVGPITTTQRAVSAFELRERFVAAVPTVAEVAASLTARR